MNATVRRLLLLVAVMCFVVAWMLTVGWVTAHGNSRDAWTIAGLALFAGSFLA